MRLVPYPSLEQRWKKVHKHVFNPGERWWELVGSLETWTLEWNALRAIGFFNGHEAWRLAGTDPSARAIVERWHDLWLEAACRAVDQAAARRQVSPEPGGRTSYVGDKGVVVIVANRDHLVTCFKVVDAAIHSDRASERTAVRRQDRRASLVAGGTLRTPRTP